MPTELGDEFSPHWRGKYPHMLPEDFPIWEKYISQHEHEFLRLYYNVRVGGQKIDDPNISPEMLRMWYKVNAKRIDVLAEKEDEIWIIEVTSRPGLRAVGQLATYLVLWLEDPKPAKPAKTVLVCEQLDPDIERTLPVYGMRAYTVR